MSLITRVGTGLGAVALAAIVAVRSCGDDVARQIPRYADDGARAVAHVPSSVPDIALPLGDEAAATAQRISPAVLAAGRRLGSIARTALRKATMLMQDDQVQDAAGLAMDSLCVSLSNVRKSGVGTPDNVASYVLATRLGNEPLADRVWRWLQPVRDAVKEVASAQSPRETALAVMQEVACPLRGA